MLEFLFKTSWSGISIAMGEDKQSGGLIRRDFLQHAVAFGASDLVASALERLAPTLDATSRETAS
jgi:hypothetical protein